MGSKNGPRGDQNCFQKVFKNDFEKKMQQKHQNKKHVLASEREAR